MQAYLGGPSGQSEVRHPPLRNAPRATLFLRDPVAPLSPTFLALLAGLWPLALRTGLWPLALLAGLWPLVLRTGLQPLACSRTVGPLHYAGRWGSPPLLWVQGAQPLPRATASQPRPGRARQPDLGTTAPSRAACAPVWACPALRQPPPLLWANRPLLSPEAHSSSPLQTASWFIFLLPRQQRDTKPSITLVT